MTSAKAPEPTKIALKALKFNAFSEFLPNISFSFFVTRLVTMALQY
jgi:hypothetical protein